MYFRSRALLSLVCYHSTLWLSLESARSFSHQKSSVPTRLALAIKTNWHKQVDCTPSLAAETWAIDDIYSLQHTFLSCPASPSLWVMPSQWGSGKRTPKKTGTTMTHCPGPHPYPPTTRPAPTSWEVHLRTLPSQIVTQRGVPVTLGETKIYDLMRNLTNFIRWGCEAIPTKAVAILGAKYLVSKQYLLEFRRKGTDRKQKLHWLKSTVKCVSHSRNPIENPG